MCYPGYFIPIMAAIFARQKRAFNPATQDGDDGASQYSKGSSFSFYMFSEMAYFECFIASGIFFILLAYIFKVKGDDVNHSFGKIPESPWAQKDALDFLDYMNDEFVDFARHGASFCMNCLMIYYVFEGFGTYKTGGEKFWAIFYFGVFAVVRLLALMDVWMRADSSTLYAGRGTVYLSSIQFVCLLNIITYTQTMWHFSDTLRYWATVELIASM